MLGYEKEKNELNANTTEKETRDGPWKRHQSLTRSPVLCNDNNPILRPKSEDQRATMKHFTVKAINKMNKKEKEQ